MAKLHQYSYRKNLHLSHMQLCFPRVSQYGIHLPCLHCPLSGQGVPSAIGADLGHSAPVPVQRLSFSQVAPSASLHFSPAATNWHEWQHGEFLSLYKKLRTTKVTCFLSLRANYTSFSNKLPAHCSLSKSTVGSTACIRVLSS